MADSMDKDGDSYLNVEYCFFDGKHKRCRDFVTLTASVSIQSITKEADSPSNRGHRIREYRMCYFVLEHLSGSSAKVSRKRGRDFQPNRMVHRHGRGKYAWHQGRFQKLSIE
jgi:hypothetical protein